ncbi:MAG: phosphoribosylamine--glycine ligase [Acidobacteriota bacterium]
MNILVVGSGGREHALAWKISQSPRLRKLYCSPGNAGTAQLAESVPLGADDSEGLLDFARSNKIDLTIVGPEAPLVAGIVDHFEGAGLAIVGPSQKAAVLEGSKAFAKDFMRRHQIPTSAYQNYQQADNAESDLRSGRFDFPLVVKADGLAAGKGVFVCRRLEEALEAVRSIMRERQFGSSGDQVVIEEYLEGEEASFMVFSDGARALAMVPSQDHKAIYDGDKGPNTGGMGAYSTEFILSPAQRQEVIEAIINPTIQGMAEEGNPYVGILYAGLMLTSTGPRVLEFNVRFGDPETQVILPRMVTDVVDVFEAVAARDLQNMALQWNSNATVCVVVAAEGYPGSYEQNKEISGIEMAEEVKSTVVFHAGTALRDGKVVTGGGRVLAVMSQAPTLEGAIIKAYEGVNKIHFEGMYYRRDIASKGLSRS